LSKVGEEQSPGFLSHLPARSWPTN